MGWLQRLLDPKRQGPFSPWPQMRAGVCNSKAVRQRPRMRRERRGPSLLLVIIDDVGPKICARLGRPIVTKPQNNVGARRHGRVRRNLVDLETAAELAGEPCQHPFDGLSKVDLSIRADGHSDEMDAIAIGKEKRWSWLGARRGPYPYRHAATGDYEKTKQNQPLLPHRVSLDAGEAQWKNLRRVTKSPGAMKLLAAHNDRRKLGEANREPDLVKSAVEIRVQQFNSFLQRGMGGEDSKP